MAENSNVGSGADGGAAGSPDQQVSQQTSQPIESDVHQMLKAYGEKLESVTKELRGLQGRQDRSDNQTNDFRKQLARLQQYKTEGMSDEEALAEMEADDASTRRWQVLEQKIDGLAARFEGVGNTSNSQQMVTTVLSEYGLDPKDPFVAGKLAGQNPTTKEQAEILAGRILRDKALAPQTNPAQQSATPGTPGGGTPADPMVKLQELMKDPVRNRKEIAEVKKQLGW